MPLPRLLLRTETEEGVLIHSRLFFTEVLPITFTFQSVEYIQSNSTSRPPHLSPLQSKLLGSLGWTTAVAFSSVSCLQLQALECSSIQHPEGHTCNTYQNLPYLPLPWFSITIMESKSLSGFLCLSLPLHALPFLNICMMPAKPAIVLSLKALELYLFL